MVRKFSALAVLATALFLTGGCALLGLRHCPITHELAARIKLDQWGDSMPKQVRISPDGRYAVVPCMGSNSIAIFATDGFRHLKSIKAGAKMPVECTFSGDGRLAYVQCMQPGIIVELDLAKREVTRRSTPHGEWPKIVELSPDCRTFWVSDWLGNVVIVLSADTLLPLYQIKVDRTPRGIGFLRTRPRAYVANFHEHGAGKGTVTEIDTDTHKVVRTFGNLRGAPRHVSVSPDDHWVYVTDMWRGLVHVIDTRKNAVVARIRVGRNPKTSDLTSNGRFLFVADFNDEKAPGSVSVVDTMDRRVVATLPAGIGTTGLDVSPDDRFLWVTNIDEDTIQVHRITTE